jgi:glycosyltransferase involved in cell wall biosynthesis
VQRAHAALTEAGVGFEILAVSDGSTDGSERTLDGMPPEVVVIVLPENRGKGGALHAGFARAQGAWLGFVDSDGDIDPAHLVQYLRVARRGGFDIVFANKKHERSQSAASGFRKLVSFGFSTVVGTLFSLGVNDTQTGCKLVRRDVMAALLPRMHETRFAFDLELFVAAVTAGYRDLQAQPVRLEERLSGSTVTKTTILRTLTDALAVLARRHATDTYRVPPEGAPAAAATASPGLRLAA